MKAQKQNTPVEADTVWSTTNYDSFDPDPRNRTQSDRFDLIESMRRSGWLHSKPMRVYRKPGERNRFVIHDGQHRFNAARKLGLPVKFVVEDCKSVHPSEPTPEKPWTPKDRIISHARTKIEFSRLVQFADQHGLTYMVAAGLLAGQFSGIRKPIDNGSFEIGDLEHAKNVVYVMHSVEGIIKWSRHKLFLLALSDAIKYSDIEIKTLIDRMKANPGMMILQPNLDTFIHMIEAIYNTRTNRKVAVHHQVGINKASHMKEIKEIIKG